MDRLLLQCSTAGVAEKLRGWNMLQSLLVQRAASVMSAVLGGFGVFCVVYSFSTPHIAAQALILLGAALAVSYFSTRS
jgi:multisubunit Na+/H+ antiporter MnhB subunit